MRSQINRRRLASAAISVATIVLAACSSKPEDKDIEQELAGVYDCPVLEVRNVKKLDGEAGPQGAYTVLFSYEIGFKGGEQGAVKLLTDWVYLRAEDAEVNRALHTPDRRTRIPRDQDGPAEKALLAYGDQVQEQLQKLIPCGGPQVLSVVMPFYEQAKESFESSSRSVVLPLAARIVRPGVMSKAESGWGFRMLAPGFNSFDLVGSQPLAMTLPPSKVPSLLVAGNGQVPASAEQTLTGVIRRGATDSCLAVTADGAEKCYGLPGEPAQAQRIFSVCQDGEGCSITGAFDSKAESLGAFSKVEKSAR